MSDQSFQKKIVFITGATSGFGEACAHHFANIGYRLLLCGRREKRLNELSKLLSPHTDVLCFALDVTDQAAVFTCIEQLPKAWQDIDILVNNAGLALGLTTADKADINDWNTMIDTNIKGLTYMTRAILPQMVKRNQGHIINIGSVAGSYAYPGGNAYGATKAFVKQFSKNLRADLIGSAIRVTNIEPGLAETEFSIVRYHGDLEAAKETYEGTIPLIADDIARTVLWASTQPSHVNINHIEVMPTCQASGPLALSKHAPPPES